MNKNLSFKINNAPRKPGVYIFKNIDDEIIYVGKAKNLFKRAGSYFQKDHQDAKTIKLVTKINSVDFTVTDNEVEALIVEQNLIKEHRPMYNIEYKDDKSYPYISITLEDKYPRMTVTREAHKKGVKYFGPYVNALALRQTVEALRSIFPMRTCRGMTPGRSSHRTKLDSKSGYTPCLNFHIEKCLAPCSKKVQKDQYREMVDQVVDFLEGRGKKTLDKLKEEMREAADTRQFERAARIRDRLAAAETVLHKQNVESENDQDSDIFGTAEKEGFFAVGLFMIRGGKLIGSEGFEFKVKAEAEPLLSFIKHYYHTTSFVPKEILVAQELSDTQTLQEWLASIRGSAVTLRKPQRGQKRRLVELASKNASHNLDFYLKRVEVESQRAMKSLKQLKEALGIKMPYRIECFDISNIGGSNAVGSMVVFENGKAKKAHYRKFKIRFDEGINDYEMMAELVDRRLKSLTRASDDKGFNTKPDLILVDGGKGQLSAAKKVLDRYYSDIDIASLAKREEELFVPGRSDAVMLPKDSSALRLVQAIRDEAHRFAIQYHRLLRSKEMLK